MWEVTITADPLLEETILWQIEQLSLGTNKLLGVASEQRFSDALIDGQEEGLPQELQIRAYFLYPPQPERELAHLDLLLQQAKEEFATSMPHIQITEHLAEDWATQWMTHWQPRPVGNQLLVCPVWLEHEPTDRMVILLDAGLAFGTGEHETSRLCLVALEQLIQGGEEIADIGCGSGILTIGALKLGAWQVRAVDLEAQAVQATLANLDHNGLTAWVVEGSVDEVYGPVDGLVCNILAPVILKLLPGLASLLEPGGWAVLSGILVSQIETILEATHAEWTHHQTLTEGQWAALILVKN